MNWDAISAIAEVVGVVAVVISLAYVAMQIRQNTLMMRSNMKQEQTTATQTVIYEWSRHPDLWLSADFEEELEPEEQARFELLCRATLRGFEAQCHHYESGLLDEQEWEGLVETMSAFIKLPRFRACWIEFRPQFSKRLRVVLDAAMQEAL